VCGGLNYIDAKRFKIKVYADWLWRGIVVNILLILNLTDGTALCCDVEWQAAPRIGDYVKIPTHAEYTFSVKSVEWTMGGAARVMLKPKADFKFKGDLKAGLNPWAHPTSVSSYPNWREYYSEKGISTPYRK
jgi:hypothetical protein